MRLNKIQLKLGQILVEKKLITQDQLESALAEQKKHKHLLLGEILSKKGFLTDEVLYRVLSEQSAIEYIKLSGRNISPDVIAQISAKLATHYQMIPLEAYVDRLVVATSSPMDIHTLDDLKIILNKSVRFVLAARHELSEAIKYYYGVGADTMEKMSDQASAPSRSVQAQETQAIDETSHDAASIVQFVNQIVLEAYRARASDIHIEPFENNVSVRYRVDGILTETRVPASLKRFHGAVLSRVKVMANLDISETRQPQDGRIRVNIEGNEIDLRISILPTPYGESIAIRLLSTNVMLGMENLGMQKDDLARLQAITSCANGVLFVTGPTGSGKTTTLYSCLSRINTPDKKILTIEDPIEYRLKGITQVQVHPRINLTFSQALRSMLRHDPDVIMVGEVRDAETADTTIRVALTGHLVFSTLHTNDAATGVTRLMQMGIDPFLIASSVQAFMAQRLVRKVCEKCRQSVSLTKKISSEFMQEGVAANFDQYAQGFGCDACRQTGYQGRTGIYEILLVNSAIKELILKRASADEIRLCAVKQNHMRTLRQDGWDKIRLGWTTPQEVLRVTREDDILV